LNIIIIFIIMQTNYSDRYYTFRSYPTQFFYQYYYQIYIA